MTANSEQSRIFAAVAALRGGLIERCRVAAMSGWSYFENRHLRAESLAMILEARRASVAAAVSQRIDHCSDLASWLTRSQSAEALIGALGDSFQRFADEYAKAGTAARRSIASLLFALLTSLKLGDWLGARPSTHANSKQRCMERVQLAIAQCRNARRLIASVNRVMPAIRQHCAPTEQRWLLPPARSAFLPDAR